MLYHDALSRIIFWMSRVNFEHILKTRRSTMTLNVDHHEMHRDAVFMTLVDLDMYHDTALLVVSSWVPASLFLRLRAYSLVSPVYVGDPDTSVSPEVLSRDSLSKSVQCRASQLSRERHSVPREAKRTFVRILCP